MRRRARGAGIVRTVDSPALPDADTLSAMTSSCYSMLPTSPQRLRITLSPVGRVLAQHDCGTIRFPTRVAPGPRPIVHHPSIHPSIHIGRSSCISLSRRAEEWAGAVLAAAPPGSCAPRQHERHVRVEIPRLSNILWAPRAYTVPNVLPDESRPARPPIQLDRRGYTAMYLHARNDRYTDRTAASVHARHGTVIGLDVDCNCSVAKTPSAGWPCDDAGRAWRPLEAC
ncbi:hypothetical protein FA95DRAFT_952079 [Auriscalpium vulgare]|uniref:Uncharacterized protein n=1 Tax=Auriscalpium vulgare TaxID=40419 RepID=A0ACB8R8X1_9AGAM|nr:hypothetical protein FA95DRAFT_952079 [Auriscalpium vulgare]